jgi:hypothetical protein
MKHVKLFEDFAFSKNPNLKVSMYGKLDADKLVAKANDFNFPILSSPNVAATYLRSGNIWAIENGSDLYFYQPSVDAERPITTPSNKRISLADFCMEVGCDENDILAKLGSGSNIPLVEYVGRPGDKVTVMLEDGGYVGILSDADHAKLEAQGPRELFRFPAEGKSFVIINDYPLEIDVIGEGEDDRGCAFWVNSKGQENPNSENADDQLTCYSIPPAGQIISIEAAGSGDDVVLYRNVDELISEVYGD